MLGGMVSNKLQRDMTPRDAVITFHCLSPDLVRVIEMIDGESTRHKEIQRCPDVVTELEQRYIFFAKQANIARRKLRLGHSCVFNVYFREP
jgi:3-hydroxyacyl-CoA dehydrogenase